jgi:hypothetical protein
VGCRISVDFHVDDDDDDGAVRHLLAQLPSARRRPLGPGQGLPRAYLELLHTDDLDDDLYAFADQDDVWHLDKLSTAASGLREFGDHPALWVSRVRPFRDSRGRRDLLDTYPHRTPLPSFGNALVETIAPGCTMVWNRPLHALARERVPGPGVLMHDSWLYLVGAALGVVVVDDRPLVDYRLHAGQAVGINSGWAHRLRRFARLLSDPGRPSIASQADEFVAAFGDLLTDEQRDLARAVADSERASLVRAWRRGELSRQSPVDNALLLPRLVLGPGR